MTFTPFRLFILLIFAFSLLPKILFAQEQLGMRLERYSGIYGANINPAHTAFTPHRWEVSLLNADLFVENSYTFLRNTSLQNALRNTDKIVSVADTSAENPLASDAILQDFSRGNRRMHLATQVRVAGPSFSFQFGQNNTIGLTTALRTHVSAYQIPSVLAYQTISDLPRNQAINIPSVGVSGMSWGEIGLHYSRKETDGDLTVAWGVSPKLLLGFEGFFTRAQSSFDYTQRLGDTVAFGSAQWEYALTTGNLTNDAVQLRRQGMGFGLDMGIAWAMPVDEGDGYAWRAGVSLVDAGFIRFGRSAQRHAIAFDTVLTISGTDFPSRDNPEQVIGDASRAFLGDTAASLQKRAFSMGLPTALSAQVDVQVAPMLYVGALLTQRIPFSRNALKRPSTLAVVPRFEHRWFSASVPLVLNDWRMLRVGAALRLAWLYVGTDHLGSFFNQDKLSGTDFYIGLKVNGFRFNSKEKGYSLQRERRGGRRGPNRKKIKCYTF